MYKPPQTLLGSKGAGTRGGFTLLEVMIAMIVTLGAAYLVSSALLGYRAHRASSLEHDLALSELRVLSSELQSMSRGAGLDPDTWAQTMADQLSPGGAPGANFDVPNLNPAAGVPQVGTLQLVVDETSSDADLGCMLGMPRDLNGDGDSLDVDVSADAVIFPLVIRLQWAGVSGNRQISHGFYLSKEQR